MFRVLLCMIVMVVTVWPGGCMMLLLPLPHLPSTTCLYPSRVPFSINTQSTIKEHREQPEKMLVRKKENDVVIIGSTT